MKRVLLALALIGLVAGANADPNDLSDGVLITHAPAGFVYSAGMDYCAEYAQYSIASCDEQVTEMPAAGYGGETLFYVVAAWNEDKHWCGTEFGIGMGFAGTWYFVEYGPCLINNLENATGGWPGAGQGTAVVATDVPWDGNYVATYYFIGYGYYADIIPLDIDPAQVFAGTGNCDVPAVTWPAVCLGAVGIGGIQGIACCPPVPPDPQACCFEDGSCQMLLEYDCNVAGGLFVPGAACDDDPYPCEVPPEPGACCDPNTGDCYFLIADDCDLINGDFLGEGIPCEPDNPCPIPPEWACCVEIYTCVILTEYECDQQAGIFFDGEDCDPDPCPTPAEDNSWGSIKALYK